MDFFSKINVDHIRGLLAIIAVIAVIAGFFFGLVSSEVFSATIGMIITHFYNNGKVTQMNKKIEEQNVEIQSLKNSNG